MVFSSQSIHLLLSGQWYLVFLAKNPSGFLHVSSADKSLESIQCWLAGLLIWWRCQLSERASNMRLWLIERLILGVSVSWRAQCESCICVECWLTWLPTSDWLVISQWHWYPVNATVILSMSTACSQRACWLLCSLCVYVCCIVLSVSNTDPNVPSVRSLPSLYMRFADNCCASFKLTIMIAITVIVIVFTAWAYARAVLGVVILSVRLSVCPSVCLSHACIVTKLNDALQIFYTTRKGNHSVILIPRVVGRRRPLPSEICVQNEAGSSNNE